jgi:hypothetical protein
MSQMFVGAALLGSGAVLQAINSCASNTPFFAGDMNSTGWGLWGAGLVMVLWGVAKQRA